MAADQAKNDPVEEPTLVRFKEIPNNTNQDWWKDPCLRINVWHCLGLCGVTFMNGYDGSLLNGLQAMDAWNTFLDTPTGWRLGAINAALYLPGIFLTWIADVISDRWGRRPSVWTGCGLSIIGAIVNAVAPNSTTYIAGRAIIGVGTALCLSTAPTLLQEIAHPRYRAKIAGFYTCIYYIASIISSWVCFGTLHMKGNISWRIPCYLQVIGPTFVIVATIGCPESPRWLTKRGRDEEALHVLSKYHANNQQDDPLVQHQIREIRNALYAEENQRQTSYLDFFRTKGNRHRLLILLVVGCGTNWVGNGIINYYLSPTLKQIGIDSAAQIDGINAGLQVWNLIISSGAALLVERVGRRFLWLFSDCGMFVSYIFAMALSAQYAKTGNGAWGIAVIPFLFLFFGSYDTAWTPLQFAYPVEILPYHMRMKGMVLFLGIQDIAVTVNMFVNSIALAAIGWKYYGVYIALLAGFITITYFTFPETKDRTIEEIAIIFEPEKAAVISRGLNDPLEDKNNATESHAHIEHLA